MFNFHTVLKHTCQDNEAIKYVASVHILPEVLALGLEQDQVKLHVFFFVICKNFRSFFFFFLLSKVSWMYINPFGRLLYNEPQKSVIFVKNLYNNHKCGDDSPYSSKQKEMRTGELIYSTWQSGLKKGYLILLIVLTSYRL